MSKMLVNPERGRVLLPAVASLCLAACSFTGAAQEKAEPAQPVQVFHLKNVAQTSEAVNINSAVRTMLSPQNKVYLVSETNDLVVSAPPDQIAAVGRLVAELDRPKRTYRITWTLADSDSGKRSGVQHFSMVVVTGQRVQMKQGDKIPVATGSYSSEKSSQETQFTYLDIGINLDATIDQFAEGLRLRSKFEQSSVAPTHQTIMGVEEPIVQQSVLEGTSVIIPGKPLVLGGIDVAGTTRHIDVEVVAEPLS